MGSNNKINPGCLLELVNAFVWLDDEHQQRAVQVIETILQDQITETKAGRSGAI